MTEKKQNQAPDDDKYCVALDATSGNINFKFCIEEGAFYVYENGYWKIIHEFELADYVSKVIRINQYSVHGKKQVFEQMKYLVKMRQDKFNWVNLFNLENGMVNPLDGELLEHNEIYYSTNRIPYKYDKDAGCPLWTKTLKEIFNGNQQKADLLQEFIGYCLSPAIQMKRALLLMGESNTGKSTILFTLGDLLGKENVSCVPLKLLGNFQITPQIINKLVNIDSDVDKYAQDYESEFRKITSGEAINANQKFIKSFNFIPKCKLILAANEFPKITDRTSAFYNRLIVIPCDRVFDDCEQNKELNAMLKKEFPGIFNWAIIGLKRLLDRKMFPDYPFMRQAVLDLENENNPSNLFFEENVIADNSGGFYLEKGELYQRYVTWAKQTNTYILNMARFSECVYKKYHNFTPKNTSHPQTRKRVWTNLRYVNHTTEQYQAKTWQDEPVSASNISGNL